MGFIRRYLRAMSLIGITVKHLSMRPNALYRILIRNGPAGGKKWPKIIVETSVKIVMIRRNMKKIFKGLIFAYAMFFSGHAINAVDTPAGAGDNADVKIYIYEKEDSAFLEKIKKAENTFSLEVSNRLNSFLATDSCVMCSIVEIEETIVAIIAKRKSGNVLICDFIYKDETLSLDDIAAIECGLHKMIEIINS
jgi:hypothetical protein